MSRVTEHALAFLRCEEGARLLDELLSRDLEGTALLAELTRLRRDVSPDLAAALVEEALLRRRARVKFSRADAMFFTPEGLEQASAEVVSRYRARRYRMYDRAIEYGCGIGGDSIALAETLSLVALERDPVRLRMARENARVYGVEAGFHGMCGDARRPPVGRPLPFWADPGRRPGGRRAFSIHRYEPRLPALLDAAAGAPGGVKLSPGVDYDELSAAVGARRCEVEVISVAGECREAVLWLDDLATCAHRATLLPGEHTLSGVPTRGTIPVSPPGAYLYEPDGAVIRAHLVETLALRIGARKIDEEIAYLTSDALVATPFASAYAVDEVAPFGLRRLNRRLRELDIGELVIKRRGFGVDPEAFRRCLTYGGGTTRRVLVLTRVRGRPTAILGREVTGMQGSV